MPIPSLLLAVCAAAAPQEPPLSATDPQGKTLALAVLSPGEPGSLYPFLSFTRRADGVAVSCDESKNGSLGCHWLNRSRLAVRVPWQDIADARRYKASNGAPFILQDLRDTLEGTWTLSLYPGSKPRRRAGEVRGMDELTTLQPIVYAYLIELERDGAESWLPLNKDQADLTRKQIAFIREQKSRKRAKGLESFGERLERRPPLPD